MNFARPTRRPVFNSGPIIPLYVNAYVPPQPRMERSYAFGEAMNRGLEALGVRAVFVTSGGVSHFPGTYRAAYAAAHDLTAEEQAALVNNDQDEMIGLGVHPFLPFMANLHIERES